MHAGADGVGLLLYRKGVKECIYQEAVVLHCMLSTAF